MTTPNTSLLLFAPLESAQDIDSPEFVAIKWTDELEFQLKRAHSILTSEDLASVSIHCGGEFPDETDSAFLITGEELLVRAAALTFTCYDADAEFGSFEARLGEMDQLQAAAERARSAGQGYFMAPVAKLDRAVVEAFLKERDARADADALLIDEDTFREDWGATAAPSGELLAHGDVAQLDLSHVWTVIEAERGHWIASPGFHVVNRMGYVTTTRPWDDNTPDAFWVRGD